jgi:uncharacterized protein (TIGR03086 family)
MAYEEVSVVSTSSGPDVVALHAKAVELFRSRVHAVPDDAWHGVTPCTDWDVAALVNHVVGEDLWTVPLMDGHTIADVGDRLDGDLLGTSPKDVVDGAAKEAVASMNGQGALDRTVHLSFGDTPASEYAWQLIADHLVHGWDLAAATGGDLQLDPQVVGGVAKWFAGMEDMYRQAGVVASRPPSAAASEQDRLLVAFGRDPSWAPAHDVVRRFVAAWEAWDLDAIMSLMADDAVFESTGPSPDGRRVEGAAAVRAEWESTFHDTKDASFTFEEAFVSGDRATARWVFSWTDDDGSAGHVRGADVMRVRDGKIAEKYSYVKGYPARASSHAARCA